MTCYCLLLLTDAETSSHEESPKQKDNEKITGDGKFEDKVTLSEDLTAVRHKLLKMCNEHENIEFAYARDGVIICKKKSGALGHVDSPDDLFKVEFMDVNYAYFLGA